MIIVLAVSLAVTLGLLLRARSLKQSQLKEQADVLSRVVGERMDSGLRVFGDVRERLGELTQKVRNIEEVGRDIAGLGDLLKAPKFRGGFGELLLERLLGDIMPSDSYELQHAFKNGSVVDAVVRIGGNLVPIDSKFPMEDFERIMKAESPEDKKAWRRQFARNIRKHIDAVARYILPDEKTFNFALMYIPAENVYYETIIRGDDGGDIFPYALERRVIPVSPNSFYAYLHVIVQGLKGLHFEKAADDILAYVSRLKGDLADFQQDYDVLGGHLRHAAAKHDEAGRRLTRLSDRLQRVGECDAGKALPGDIETGRDDRLP